MIVYPAIDLKDGQCVRLKQGDFDQATIYSNSPTTICEQFKQEGAEWLHIVDLDGAKHKAITQLDVIAAISQKFDGNIQVGGGVRTTQDIEKLLGIGAKRVVVGSICTSAPETVSEWLHDFGPEKIVLALDFRIQNNQPYLAISGWQEDSDQTLWDVIENIPLAMHVLCTDISLDGMEKGPNFALYEKFIDGHPQIRLQASGGIRNINDIQTLKTMGAAGCIIGKALYEGHVSLKEVVTC